MKMTDYFASSAQMDENMAEIVKKYPILYDKQKRGYRDENAKQQTWQMVADEGDVGTADAARKLFDNLKKRFLKKRLKYRKLKASGMPSEMIGAAKDEMDSYSFLNWLVPHIRMRRTKRDLNNMEMSGMMEAKRDGNHDVYGSDECGSSFDENENYEDDGEMENATMVPSSITYAPPTCYTKPITPISMVNGHGHSPQQNQTTNGECESLKRKMDTTIAAIKGEPNFKKRHALAYPIRNGSGKPMNGNSKSDFNGDLSPEDETDLFGKMIAAEMKTFSARDQCIAKHRIRTVLFEVRMFNFSQATSSQLPSHPVYVVSGSSDSISPSPHRHTPRSRPPGYTLDPYYAPDSSISKESNE